MSASDDAPTGPSRLRQTLHQLVGPAALDFWAARLSPLLSWEQPLARVLAVEPASADAVTLTLQANRHWQGCAPGQHLDVGVEVDGRRLLRSYSPAPAGDDPRRFTLTVKRYPGGRVSEVLSRQVKPGDVLPISQAYGSQRLGAPEAAPRLFLAAGSGITPLWAMLGEWANAANRAPLTLCYWARRREELCFVDALRALATTHPEFSLRLFLTGQACEADDEYAGRISAAHLEALALPWAALQVHACGPDAFVTEARALIGERVAGFHSESFVPPVPAGTEAEAVRITLARSRKTVDVPRGAPLLGALEALGIVVAAGCRRGICHRCACGKRTGVSRDLRDGRDSHESASALQLCVSAALGDLVLEL